MYRGMQGYRVTWGDRAMYGECRNIYGECIYAGSVIQGLIASYWDM